MEPPTEVEVDEVAEVWEIEDVPARRFGSSRDQVKIQSATETQRHRVKKQEKKLNAENTEDMRSSRRVLREMAISVVVSRLLSVPP